MSITEFTVAQASEKGHLVLIRDQRNRLRADGEHDRPATTRSDSAGVPRQTPQQIWLRGQRGIRGFTDALLSSVCDQVEVFAVVNVP